MKLLIALSMALLPRGLAADVPLPDEGRERFVGVRIVHRSGGVTEGLLVDQNAETLYVSRGPGRVGISRSRVERVEYGRNVYVEFKEREARTDHRDAGALWSLSRWAAEKGLSAFANDAARRVLEAVPDHAGARAALGYALHEGRWLKRDEIMRAKGFVRYKGDWLTPEALEAAKAEEAEIRRARIESARLRKELRIARARAAAERHRALAARYAAYQAYLNRMALRAYYPGCGLYRGHLGYWTYGGGTWVFHYGVF